MTFGRQYGPALLAHLGGRPRAFQRQFSTCTPGPATSARRRRVPPGTDRNTPTTTSGIFFSNAIGTGTVGPVNFGSWRAPAAGRAAPEEHGLGDGRDLHRPVVLSGVYQVIKDKATASDNVRHGGLGSRLPLAPSPSGQLPERAQ